MSTMISSEIFDKDNYDFISNYIGTLSRRITESAISVDNSELMKTVGINIKEIQKVLDREKDIYKSFLILLPKLLKREDLTINDIIDVGNAINGSKKITGLRSDNTNDIDNSIEIPDYKDLETELNKLLYNYYNTWANKETFVKEAMFHINFIRMCPFPDGNHRIAILLLAYNLVNQGIAPTVISNDLTKYYDKYILESNYEEMANMFKIQSIKENLLIKEEFNKFKGIDN